MFIAVTDAGGFSAAQLTLNVGQSTISTQMSDLESRLGVTLCRRGRAGFALTEDGHEVYQAAVELFGGCNRFNSRINQLHSEVIGDLRVGMADSLVDCPEIPLSEIISEFRKRAPQVSLVMTETDPLTIEQFLLSNRLDVAIHCFPGHVPGLRYRSLFDEQLALYCGADHPLFNQADETITQNQLEMYDYVGRTYYGGALRTGRLQPQRVAAKCSTMDGVASLILSGKYLSHLPRWHAENWVKQGRMRSILPDAYGYSNHFECIFPAGQHTLKAARVFEEVAMAHAQVKQPAKGRAK